ncbi:AraC family transcriptional regulator, partial [Rhizobium ruizarguesonis]
GDFIGEFEPGNLVLAGPNLPNNWISDVPKGSSIPLRCQLIKFRENFISGTMKVLAELGSFDRVLEASRRGVLFGAD